MNNTPTPETDAETIYCDAMPNMPWVDADICRKLERERDEAREDLEFRRGLYKVQEEYLETARRERDKAREEIENVKLQLGLWEDGNIICEETLGEIRLLEEQIKQYLLERNKAYKIAEQAIEDLAWFNETSAQLLRHKLEQLKEGAK